MYLESDVSLRERVRLKFKEQGINSCEFDIHGVTGEDLTHVANLYGVCRNSIPEENNMASLSKRVVTEEVTTKVGPTNSIDSGVNNMTVKTLNVTLVDNNSNLKGAGKIVFQKLGFITEHSNEEAKMDIIATGKVMEALKTHNDKREETVDKQILRNTGRDVMLEPIELLSDSQLQWQIIQVA
jgi:hypothetical protein